MSHSDPSSSGCPFSNKGIVNLAESGFQSFLETVPDAMVVVDESGLITLVNSQTLKLFGYGAGELIGQLIEVLLPQRFRDQHVTQRTKYVEAPKVRAMGVGLELLGLRKNGTEFPIEISLSPVRTENGLLIASAIRDTTTRREIENRLRASVREKEVLLKEVHHRVKNNLQVISSLLNFQADLITDSATRSMFQDTRARIKSIALIHERLYQSEDLIHIDFAEYIRGLMDDLFDSFGTHRDRIRLAVDIDGASLDVDTLVNCGLIVSELATNSLKYAFPNDAMGVLAISLKSGDADNLTLTVQDDGIGLSPEAATQKKNSLGLKLVRGLAKELGGSLQIDSGKGTRSIITFTQAKGVQESNV